MKVWLVLVLSLLLAGCNLFGQSNAYDFEWDPNPEPDMLYYTIYTWVGTDTALAVGNYQLFGNFNHDSLKLIYPTGKLRLADIFMSQTNGEYLGIAGEAVDNSLNISLRGYSPFVKKDDTTPPAPMSGLGVTQ